MEKISTDNLVLLEFVVDSVDLDMLTQQNLEKMKGDMCISFQFLENSPLIMCEEDYNPRKKGELCPRSPLKDTTTKNGKSCLFALNGDQVNDCSKEFNVQVILFKKLKDNTLPNNITVGQANLKIHELFNQVAKESQKAGVEQPVAKTAKEVFKLLDVNEAVVGEMAVFVRMSCFGRLIVTQFQMNLQEKSVEFKAKEGNYLFTYNKKDGRCPATCKANIESPLPCPPQLNREPPLVAPKLPGVYEQCAIGGGYHPSNSPYPSGRQGECPATKGLAGFPQGNQAPCPLPICSPPNCPPPPLMNQCQKFHEEMKQLIEKLQPPPCHQCSPPPPQPPRMPPPEGNYQEIGAEMGGNSLIIRVHKDNASVQQVDADGNSCPVHGTTVSSCPVHGTAGTNCPMHGDVYNCPSDCPMTYAPRNPPEGEGNCPCSGCPASPLKPQPINYANPGNPACPFNLKVNGMPCPANNNVSITPPAATAQPKCGGGGNDPNKDKEVFILKIGKKSEKNNKKNNLELELCTPKAKELKPLPKMETRDTQVEKGDVPAEPNKGNKGDKKPGKGKKDKKTKKKK